MVAPAEPIALIPDDAEIPMRPRSKAQGRRVVVSASSADRSAPSACSSTGSCSGQSAPKKGIPAYFAKPAAKKPVVSSLPVASSVSRASSSSAPPSVALRSCSDGLVVPGASSSADPRMTSLEAQVAALSAQLEEQVKLNRQLQQQLSQVLSQCADLTLSLRVLKSKRSHSASASATGTPERASAMDVHMSPSGAPSGPARRLAVGGQPLDDGYL